MVPFQSEFGKEVTLGGGFDLEGDVNKADAELLEFVTTKVGFSSVEVGPLTSNKRIDYVYKPEQLEATGFSVRALTMIRTFKGLHDEENKVFVSALVQPSYGLVNLSTE